MLMKWTLVAFGIAAVVLFVLSKILAFMNPPRPERPRPPALRRVERALRRTPEQTRAGARVPPLRPDQRKYVTVFMKRGTKCLSQNKCSK